MGPRLVVLAFVLAVSLVTVRTQQADLALDPVLRKMAAYVDSYGEKASLIVAVENYLQRFGTLRPRELTAEFAIVKTAEGWVGYRDVVEVDGQPVGDRRDRLLSILTDPAADGSLAKKLSDESARYNIGPISRTFNLPTTVLLLFQPANLARFTFKRSGTDRINGVETWKIDFVENRKPTFTMTRSGRDVPMEGTLWVVAADGAVIRTRMRMKNFADLTYGVGRIESSAYFDVTYHRHPELEMWLPATMTENYEGPVQVPAAAPVRAIASAIAKYSDFRRFQTGATIKVQR